MGAIRQDLEIEQGVPFSTTFGLTDDSGAPFDLTDYTFKSQMRLNYSAPSVVAEFTVAEADPGVVKMSLTATQTAAIPVDPAISFEIKKKPYAYDLFLIDPSGVPFKLACGVIEVVPEVTKL